MDSENAYFLTRKPKKSALSPYISYYYFHTVQAADQPIRFAYYPNYKNALTIYKNSTILFSEQGSKAIPNTTINYSSLYSGIQTTVRSAELVAPFIKIGIVFQAFGISPFVKSHHFQLQQNAIDKSCHYFGEDLEHCCDKVHSEEDIDRKVDILDDFFLAQLSNPPDQLFKSCIDFIVESQEKPTVNGICQHFSVNRKTLLRLFQKEFDCSVKDFIHIVQFRKALNHYLLTNSKDSLTELALNGDYYDQSQFIAHFKKLTGFNPRTFFKQVNRLGQEDTFWTFE